jgi:uncharacterized protein (DUF1684 family)
VTRESGWLAGALVLAVMLTACGRSGGDDVSTPADLTPSIDEHRLAVETWRAQHDRSYREQYVTIAGLVPLAEGPNPAGSGASNAIVLPERLPASVGQFVLRDGAVRFEPAAGVDVRLRDEPVTRPIDLNDDGTSNADELVIGDVRLVVHVTGERKMIRIRDPQGPWATGFVGFSWFPIDLQYRVVGRFIPDVSPARVRVPNTFGDMDEFSTEGVVEFTLLGETVRLRPFTTRPNRLWFVFRDGSSGVETYEAARFLYADLQADGRVVLDFNMAYNPPCAFNPYTTCPIPMPENRLTLKILAGEKAYPIDVQLPMNAD